LESPHLLVIEDRNAPGEADKDPFRKFQGGFFFDFGDGDDGKEITGFREICFEKFSNFIAKKNLWIEESQKCLGF
jgi:hypothetical protein